MLLQTFYKTGAIGQPCKEAKGASPPRTSDEYWRQLDHLAERLNLPTESLGVVGHSVRAVPLEDLEALARGAGERGMLFHIHVEEQRQEIAASLNAYGKRPMEVVFEKIFLYLSPSKVTAIHCTHSDPEDLKQYLAAGANVCLCPLTEANLGDGFSHLPSITGAAGNGQVAIGTDSNVRFSMLEEMRLLEFAQRLRREERGAVRDEEGRIGRLLLGSPPAAGQDRWGSAAGAIAEGNLADFVAVDMDHPSLAFAPEESFEDAPDLRRRRRRHRRGLRGRAVAGVSFERLWKRCRAGGHPQPMSSLWDPIQEFDTAFWELRRAASPAERYLPRRSPRIPLIPPPSTR